MGDSKAESGYSFSVGDIYYVLFKHKWKILTFALAGLVAAGAVYRHWPDTVYRSDAKLFIRYVQESEAPRVETDEAQIKSTDQRGETVINSEIEILTSMDLAKQVALALGPEQVLRAYGGGSDLTAAAGVIRQGLSAAAARGSRVLAVSFEHPDRDIVQKVLGESIEVYLRKHVEIHMTSGMFDDMLSRETQLLRDRLAQTEEELRKVQDKAGVLSLEETKRAYGEQMAKARQQISDTMAELNEREALLKDYEDSHSPAKAVPSADAQEYRNILTRLDSMTRKHQDLLGTFSADSAILTNLRRQIAEQTAAKEKLEAEYPPLAVLGGAPRVPDERPLDIPTERARLRALSIRLQVLQSHFERIRKEAADISALEMSVNDLQRRKDLQESHYRYFSSSLEKSRINEALGGDRVSNISVIQAPTAPARDVGKLYKVVSGLAGGGLLFGLVLAFCLELFLDQTVRRPTEVETRLGLPLFFSIPNIGGWRWFPRRTRTVSSSGELGSYFDALRDRLIYYFEVRELTKKPKLIAVTSCGGGAGVSTVAAGLAAALSKTGDGNVLLVDMNPESRGNRHFVQGTARVGLDELLDGQHREEAMVQSNLYVVPHATGTDRLARIQPKRFTSIVPRLRASDYDYVIFDMPAVNQISVTPQIARFMDMVFLLVESEKTNRDALKRATDLLAQASCTLGVIVNRTRNYLPRTLLQEV